MILRSLIFLALLLVVVSSMEKDQYSPPLIPLKSQQMFRLTNTVTMKEPARSSKAETLYTFSVLLKINSKWNNEKDQLLQIFFYDPRVSATSKVGQEKQQEIHKIPDRPFYVSLIGNIPTEVIAHSYRDQWLVNLERGIASLLQIQYRVGPTVETDVSGMCNVLYNAKTVQYVEKRKKDCSNWDLKMAYRGEPALGIFQRSVENLVFEMTPEGALLKVTSQETHKLYLAAQPEVGSIIESSLVMEHVDSPNEYVEQFQFETLNQAIQSLLEWYRVFEIEGEVDGAMNAYDGPMFKELIAINAKKLSNNMIGQPQLAETFAKLLTLSRYVPTDEFKTILKEHPDLQPQLVDLMGATQTIEAHKAINETFNYKNHKDMAILEKYLQSLAVATHPDEDILVDLFNLLKSFNDEPHHAKIIDSITQCLASLAHHLMGKSKQNDIREYFVRQLKKECGKDMECKHRMIRALQNMLDPKTIDVLIGYAFRGDTKLSVAAMQALRRFPITLFKDSHRLAFTYMLYQVRRKYDTSARTMALDILLELRPSKEEMDHLVEFIASNDSNFEVKTYAAQRLQMYCDKYPKFKAFVQQSLNDKPHVNNYHGFAQKGFSSVLSRDLSLSPAFNETLLSVQEVYKGVLKRGSVELLMKANNHESSTFKLGIFTSGLETFISDNDDEEEEDDEDETEKEYKPLTAGMEISVNGIAHRPLVFFTGKAELMGHIWSGTVSESTPAFQATMLVHDHEQFLILGSGATALLNVLGARSIDLSGKAGFSLWNRNADTEIKKDSALAVYGWTKVGFTYGYVEHEFDFSYKPNLALQAHIDFYDKIKLCMRLQRPELKLKHHSSKKVAINASHKYSKKVQMRYTDKFPGHTYALNQKNNEMCRMVSKDLKE